MIEKDVKVYLGRLQGIADPIRLSQYDTNWRFRFTVYNGDTVWTIPAGASVMLEGRKKDGTVFTANATIDGVNVIVDCTPQLTSVSGDVECELRFSTVGRIIGVANFVFKVEAAPFAGHTASADDFSGVDQLVNQVMAEAERIGDVSAEIERMKALVGSPLIATSKAGMTNTEKVYVYQRSPSAETGMTNGNWYYYEDGTWKSGGIYNSAAVNTDKTLAVEDQAADGKATGDAITLARASVYAGEQDVSFTSSSGYVDTSEIGADWTTHITSIASYKYIDGGIDVSSYRTFNGRIRLSVPQIASNSARFGFADNEDKIVWVTTNKAVKDSYVYNSTTGMYELFIPIFGDKFFYSNATIVAQPHLMSISLLFDSSIVDEGAFSGQGESGEVGDPRIRYIAPDGDNEKSGLSPETALSSIYQAFKLGAETVICAPGTYTYQYISPPYVANRSIKIIGNGAIFDGTTGVKMEFEDCNVEISGLTVQNARGEYASGFWFKNCTGKIVDCAALNNDYMGFRMSGSSMTFIRCHAEGSGVDGFNGHTSNDNIDCDCTFIDCTAKDCGDDGLSLHEYCHFTVIGGEFSGCTSTGIAPHQWCSAEIYGAYVHDNGSNGASGIEAKNPNYTSGTKARVMTFGNLITNNGGYGIDTQNDILISVGDKFDGNASGTVHEGTGAQVIVY